MRLFHPTDKDPSAGTPVWGQSAAHREKAADPVGTPTGHSFSSLMVILWGMSGLPADISFFRGPILETLLNLKSKSGLGCCLQPFVIGADRAERLSSNCANKPTINPWSKQRCTIPYVG